MMTTRRPTTRRHAGSRPAAHPAVTAVLLALGCALPAACGDSPAAPSLDDGAVIELEHIAAPDPATEGRLQLWVFAGGVAHSAGRLELGPGTMHRIPVASPVARPDSVLLTLEPPGDADDAPSPYRLLRGVYGADGAELGLRRALTNFHALETEPGAHSLYTTSNNAMDGYPSLEDCGMWLFNMFPATNPTGERWVQLSQLKPEWLYEGWIVYRPGSPEETWISYGKFRPDERGFLTARDHTGSGPFSGDLDYVNGGVEEVPGDEWTTPHPEFELPPGLGLPLDLNEEDPDGTAVWHHRITIEPAFDAAEPIGTERPFILRPYGNPIGAGDAHVPRFIRYFETAPSGVLRAAGG